MCPRLIPEKPSVLKLGNGSVFCSCWSGFWAAFAAPTPWHLFISQKAFFSRQHCMPPPLSVPTSSLPSHAEARARRKKADLGNQQYVAGIVVATQREYHSAVIAGLFRAVRSALPHGSASVDLHSHSRSRTCSGCQLFALLCITMVYYKGFKGLKSYCFKDYSRCIRCIGNISLDGAQILSNNSVTTQVQIMNKS